MSKSGYIILPQALRRVILECSNKIVYLVKYSSLAFINPKGRMPRVYPWMNGNSPECVELGSRNVERCHRLARGFPLMVSVVTKVLNTLEKKLEIPGIG